MGEVIVELTKMRAPCHQLDGYGAGIQKAVYNKPAVKADDHTTPTWGLSGFYASVIEGGLLAPGAPVLLLEQSA